MKACGNPIVLLSQEALAALSNRNEHSVSKPPPIAVRSTLLDEMFTEQQKEYRCNLCGVTKPHRKHMISHVRYCHSELRPHKCHVCDKSFKRSFTLTAHILAQHDPNRPIYSCDKCSFSTGNRSSFRWHYYRLHGDGQLQQFTCYHCGRKFKTKRELTDHIAIHGDSSFMCEICGKFYRGRHLLRAHLSSSHVQRREPAAVQFVCSICNRRLSCQRALDEHVKLHQRFFQCQDCGKKFSSKKWLLKHCQAKHTDAQPASYTCRVCDKDFATAAIRKVHSLLHVGLKPYRCNVCGAAFTQRTPMMMHWRKKHPEETELPPPVRLNDILRNIDYVQST